MPRRILIRLAKASRAFARAAALAGAIAGIFGSLAMAAGNQERSPQGLTEPRALEFAQPAEFAGPLALRPEVTVDGAYVRLSDIFANLPPSLDAIVAAAPRLGDSTVFDADWLRRVAQQHALDWAPRSRFDQVIVVRDTEIIGREQIVEALRPNLIRQGMPQQAEIRLNGTSESIRIPIAAGAEIAVTNLQYDGRASTVQRRPGSTRREPDGPAPACVW